VRFSDTWKDHKAPPPPPSPTSIVSGLSQSSKFAKHIIDCMCHVPREVDCGTSPPGSLIFKRFSFRLAKFIAAHSKLLYSSLANVLLASDLRLAACVLELIIDTLVAVKSITFLDTSPNFGFLQNVLRPLHLKVKGLSASDSRMQHLCARFVRRICNLHSNLREEISHEMSSCLFDICYP